ncbi:ATP-binding protein [Streptomyces sp. NPDC127097]|uniref:ATP-binding protein n=1 Tax=Streptomyces sp. NPDC127097 TaxID=3347136 RepID=UPI003661A5E4
MIPPRSDGRTVGVGPMCSAPPAAMSAIMRDRPGFREGRTTRRDTHRGGTRRHCPGVAPPLAREGAARGPVFRRAGSEYPGGHVRSSSAVPSGATVQAGCVRSPMPPLSADDHGNHAFAVPDRSGSRRSPSRPAAPGRPGPHDRTIWRTCHSVGHHTSCRLAHHPQAVRQARQMVRSWLQQLQQWQLAEDAAASVVLVVSELVTNAVQHTRPPLALHVRLEHAGLRVWVGITNGGPSARKGAWAASPDQDEHGRGMDIVGALATAYGTRNHEDGTTRWARLPGTDQSA